MSGPEKYKEDSILLRMIEIEEQKIRSDNPGQQLAPEKIALVKARLLSEKDTILADFDRQSPVLSLKKSNPMKVWASIGIAALVLAGILIPSLLRTATNLEGTIAALSGNVKVNGKAAQSSSKISVESMVEVGEKSLAKLVWSDLVQLALGPGTQIKVQRANSDQGKPDLVLENINGVLFCEVRKNQAHVKIQTASIMVRVTGTSFNVEVSTEGTTVQVLEGTVEATANPEFLQTVSDPAQRERLSKPIQIGTKQKMLLSKAKMSITLSEVTAAEEQYLLSLGKLDSLKKLSSNQNEAQKMTLAEIKTKYGKISKVNLKNGATYTGFFKLNGAQMEIITTTGTIRVPTSQLRDVQDVE